ncbi:hypothetical protein LPJ59_002898 [Coemansia sp. RSA 2399]|nr:hypothetical protein LPJ59_002898 [Coemansia sp. RSA 2399]KAJ1904305.1 hypothetical protein LPJ81_002567 [Coemansia sp. IMI 209127]
MDELGQILSFDGLIEGMSPIKKGDAPHDELTPPLADDEEGEEESRRSSDEEEEEEDFDLDAFVATKYRKMNASHKSFVDRLGGSETGDALPKRNRTRTNSTSPTSSATKKKKKNEKKKKAAASAEVKHKTTPTTTKRKR